MLHYFPLRKPKQKVSKYIEERQMTNRYRLPSTVYRLPSTVYRLPSTVYRLPSTVSPILRDSSGKRKPWFVFALMSSL